MLTTIFPQIVSGTVSLPVRKLFKFSLHKGKLNVKLYEIFKVLKVQKRIDSFRETYARKYDTPKRTTNRSDLCISQK